MRRWRVLALISMMLAVALFPQLTTEAATLGQPVRVGLYYGGTALPEVRIASDNGLTLAQLVPGNAAPTSIFDQPGQASWVIRQDAVRLQFGPYSSLISARAVLATMPAEKIKYVVRENEQFFVRFGAYDTVAVAQQVLKLITSQPGTVIGCQRVVSGMLSDLATASALRATVAAQGLPVALAWSADGWRVAVGHEVSAEKAEALRQKLTAAIPTEVWTIATPDLGRSEVYSFEGEQQLSLSAMDMYVGASSSRFEVLDDSALTTLYSGGGSKRYRGFVELTLQNGAYRTLLYQTIDQYIMGVLPGEVYPSWPMDALKAQAVVTRTFTQASRGKHAASGFDFCTTTNCQVHVDFSRETASTKQAVNETAGEFVTYGGKVASVYYSSSAGGHSESIENVWGGAPIAWLTGVPELFPDESSYAHWEKSFTGAELSALLKKNNLSIGTVASVQPTGYTTAGRVMGLKLTDTLGKSVTLTGETQLRLFYGLSSRRYTVQRDNPPVNVLGADGQVVKLNPTGLKVSSVSGTSTLARTDAYRIRGADSTVSSSAVSTGFTFVGSGSGHGAGLSQWGAYAMAKNGYSYSNILKHYFPGTEILRLGD